MEGGCVENGIARRGLILLLATYALLIFLLRRTL
jgi:hypothetical protein